MSLSAAWTDLTSGQSLTDYKLSSKRDDSPVMSAKIIRSDWVSLEENSSVWILEY